MIIKQSNIPVYQGLTFRANPPVDSAHSQVIVLRTSTPIRPDIRTRPQQILSDDMLGGFCAIFIFLERSDQCYIRAWERGEPYPSMGVSVTHVWTPGLCQSTRTVISQSNII